MHKCDQNRCKVEKIHLLKVPPWFANLKKKEKKKAAASFY